MYADDSTIYAPATTANEVTETLNKELQSVLESDRNKLVPNISKTKSIESCNEWLGFTLDCKLVKTSRFNGCKDGEVCL